MTDHTQLELNNPTGPVDDGAGNESEVSRRKFFKAAVGTMCVAWAGIIGYPVYRYLESPVERSEAAAAITDISLDGAQTLPKGSVMMFKFGQFPAMLIHHQNDEWVAFNAVCTHLGCTVEYHTDQDKIICACHGGTYDARTGNNISGPPPKPLTKYAVKVNATSVTVSRA